MTDYPASWTALRSRWRQFFTAWLGGWILAFGMAYLSFLVFHTFVLGWVAGIAWMIAFAVTGIRVQSFRCPRCGQPFFARSGTFLGILWFSNNPLCKTCGSCGLEKGAAA